MKRFLPYLSLFALFLLLIFVILNYKDLVITGNVVKNTNNISNNIKNSSVPDHIFYINDSDNIVIKEFFISGMMLNKGNITIYLKNDNQSLLVFNKTNYSKQLSDKNTKLKNISFNARNARLEFFVDNTTFNLTKVQYLFYNKS
jgi:hypothetical protein